MPQHGTVDQPVSWEEGREESREPAQSRSLEQTVDAWTEESVSGPGLPRPLRKRLAVLVTGLVAGEPATRSHLTGTIKGLAVTGAKEESIARRLLRIVEDERLDPHPLLPTLFRAWLPKLLAGLIAAHAAHAGSGPGQHRRFLPVRRIVAETSKDDPVHLLVAGLAYQGIVLPWGVRCWEQNAPLPAGDYWSHLGSLRWEVYSVLPAVPRDHVLLLADRGYGTPRLLDLLAALGWSYVLPRRDRLCAPRLGSRPRFCLAGRLRGH